MKGLGVVLLATVSGCSFVFAEGPPVDHEHMPYFDCVSTYGLPVADGFFGVSGVAGAAMTLAKSKQEYADQNKGANRDAVAGVNIAVGVAYAASAVYGIVQATRCTNAKMRLKARFNAPPSEWTSPRLPPPPGMAPPLPASPTPPSAPSAPVSPTPPATPTTPTRTDAPPPPG